MTANVEVTGKPRVVLPEKDSLPGLVRLTVVLGLRAGSKQMLSYANRILAAGYVLGWLLWATSVIGETGSGKPITWWGAWSFALVIAVAVWLGWQARREVEQA